MVSKTDTNKGNTDRDRSGRSGRRGRKDEEKNPYVEKVVSVRRVSKVVKGGRNLSFAAFVDAYGVGPTHEQKVRGGFGEPMGSK